jgi:uncharacterized Fe-S center protein
MTRSKVYYTNLRTTCTVSLLDKLENLVKRAGIENLSFQNKFTALKIHVGEIGNLAHIHPNYAKVIVDIVKENGGKPFLTDCNTLYVGTRKNALDHLETAYENGFSPFSTGCHFIVADGIKGTDEAVVAMDGEYIKLAKIGRAIKDADIFISLNHFKGHELTGFGGALKNIGMGCGSRGGKWEMHSSGQPFVAHSICEGCGSCVRNCKFKSISMVNHKATIHQDICVGCGLCIGYCPNDAIISVTDEANDILNKKIAEYTYAVLKDKPNFHINFVLDVSPYCDCYTGNDVSIIPDVGIFASFDPVALDMACADIVNKQPVIRNSLLGKCACEDTKDYFTSMHSETNWLSCLEHAVKFGVGSMDYDLIEV